MSVERVIEPRLRDLGGFSVRRVLPFAKRRMVGPWIFFDHMGPTAFPAGQGIDVLPHPHIGLATVTCLFEGEILHRDSLGSQQLIRPGDINLMLAGRGIAHSEREADAVRARPHSLHGLQLWHALPVADEETEPAFYHYPSVDLPKGRANGVDIRVLIGSAYGLASPVRTWSDTLYGEARMQAGQSLPTPPAAELALYLVSGAATMDGHRIAAQTMAVLAANSRVMVRATADSHLILIGGAPLGERFMEWNFVSSRKQRLTQASEDWRAGRFPKVVGDEEAFTPLPESRG
ncbi:MAG: pirin family protein [Rhodospirillales bacterium]|nr:pirin family protein [Rhodospirillales bacterium]